MCVSLHKLLQKDNKLVQGRWVRCWSADWASGGDRVEEYDFFFLFFKSTLWSLILYCSSVTAIVRIGMNHTHSLNRGANHTLSLCVCVCVWSHVHTTCTRQLRSCEQKHGRVLFVSLHIAAVIQNESHVRRPQSLIVLRCWWRIHAASHRIKWLTLCLLLILSTAR